MKSNEILENVDISVNIHVRRVNGKELTDEEMIEYYTNLVKDMEKNNTDDDVDL